MTPTYEFGAGFAREYARMPRRQRLAFRAAIAKFVEASRGGRSLPRSLRIKRVQGSADIWEMSYSGDGRATFRYGKQRVAGEAHVVWLRVGGHEIFDRPE